MSQVRVNPRPRGLRRFLPLVVAAWVVLEIWLLIELAGLIGGFWLLCYLVGSVLLGGWVIKRAGLRALRSTAAGMRGGDPLGATGGAASGAPSASGAPGASAGDPLDAALGNETRTAVTIAGGLLLMLPGVLSDLLGLACLFPPTAALLRRAPDRWLRRSTEQFRIHRPDGRVVPGEVIVGEVVDPDPFAKKQQPYDYGRDPDQLR